MADITLPEGLESIGEPFGGCSKNLTLIVAHDSYAETYAKENNLKFGYIGECLFHNYASEVTTEATCTEEGKMQGSHCSVCNTVIEEQETIQATGHSYTSKTTKATTAKNGSITETCSACGDKKNPAAIYAVKTVSMSKTAYTYNKKVQKPSVTVKDNRGKALKANTDYTVSYPKDMKNVGSYTVTISFKGNYSGTVKKTFTIAPKGTEISKVTGKKKGFSLKWKKQSEQTTGYEIAYSTGKNFKKAATKTVTVGKNKTTSKSVSKLAAKKKYYVKIRTYKTVKVNGKSTKIYSAWSKVKNVATKK